ncbi:uncharacterized protein CEXT_323601 [Caerostris extrusa]|uniref:Uncharacterized protein n=1 Tax=Caerostris extrusa TaxID=172846 RepID=A0AAV4SDD4_CAEEX|nr:uncharacterized protein CEXT_323601 [Caerostris extrusa]
MPPPLLQKPFEIPKEILLKTETLNEKISSPAPSRMNMIAKHISYTIPKKYILPILERLRETNYVFNEMNELEKDGKTEYRRNGIDLFNYMRNERAIENGLSVSLLLYEGF